MFKKMCRRREVIVMGITNIFENWDRLLGKIDNKLDEKLSDKRRSQLKDSDFVFPKEKKWPIQTEQQAKMALIWSTWPQNKKVAEEVRQTVFKKYPDLKDWFLNGKYGKKVKESEKEGKKESLKREGLEGQILQEWDRVTQDILNEDKLADKRFIIGDPVVVSDKDKNNVGNGEISGVYTDKVLVHFNSGGYKGTDVEVYGNDEWDVNKLQDAEKLGVISQPEIDKFFPYKDLMGA